MKFVLVLCFISLVSIGKGQSSKKVSYIPLPKWVDTTNGIIINVNTNFTKDGTCLYDSMGRLIRVESGKCSLLEMVYDKGKWVPYSKCSYYKSKHIKEQTKIDTITPPHGGMAYPDPMQPIPRDTGKPCTRCWPKIKDTTPPSFHDMVFLMQQNMELSERLDRLERRIDSLEKRPFFQLSRGRFLESNILVTPTEFKNVISGLNLAGWSQEDIDAQRTGQSDSPSLSSMLKRLDSLERRPVIYIDTLHQQLWVKCPDGSCDIFIRKL